MSNPACAAVTPLFWAWENAQDLRSKKIAKEELLRKLKEKVDDASLDLSNYDFMCIKLMEEHEVDYNFESNSIKVNLMIVRDDALDYIYFPLSARELLISRLQDYMDLSPLERPGLERIESVYLSNSNIVGDHLKILPPSVKSMGIISSTLPLDHLPSFLTNLSIKETAIHLESGRVRLPKSLASVAIHNCTFQSHGMYSQDSFSLLHGEDLPENIMFLGIRNIQFVTGGLNIDFRWMPASIVSIWLVNCGISNIEIDPTNLPQSLKEIHLSDNPLSRVSIEKLIIIKRDNPGIKVVW